MNTQWYINWITPEVKSSSSWEIDIKKYIDLVRDKIISFTGEYQPFSTDQTYYGGTPIFSSLQKESWIENFNFYISDKDISKLSKCNTQNYLIALRSIDKLLLKSWETFNANEELAKQDWYCTGRGEKNFLFYWGVCGMTSQLFRSALMNPNVEILERHNHSEWFVHYYGEEIWGDDAAIYQMNKQFKIKNISNQDIYFRTKEIGNYTYLVAITAKSLNDSPVKIKKEKITNRKIELKRIIWTKTEVFTSVYTNKNYELR